MSKNTYYYTLRKRLESSEKWADHYLEVEQHRKITKKAENVLYDKHPFIFFLCRLLYIPSDFVRLISDIIWWYRYHKCLKEIEIIRKEIESYE
tara:strand:- start:166 stop:444 length:279 start_codon:yes stop_codon:yes gene_type:complete